MALKEANVSSIDAIITGTGMGCIEDSEKFLKSILDNKEEFNLYDDEIEMDTPCNLGIRIAAEEQPDSQFYTSRLGVRMEDVIDFYNNKIAGNPNFRVKLLHFFINSGITDSPYYWNELEKYVTLYCKFKKINPELDTLDIGGGMPFKDSLVFDFDYEYMVNEIVKRIKEICAEHDVMEPDIDVEPDIDIEPDIDSPPSPDKDPFIDPWQNPGEGPDPRPKFETGKGMPEFLKFKNILKSMNQPKNQTDTISESVMNKIRKILK